MHSRLSGLALALALVPSTLLAGCGSDDAPAATPTSSTPSPSSPAANPAAAVVMPKGLGVFTSCVVMGDDDGDYLWSGTQFKARGDATLEDAGPTNLTNMRVVGAWIAEDPHDDGIFAAWSRAQDFLDRLGPLTPAKGAALAAGTTYRLVLRLQPPTGSKSGEAKGFDVTWSSADGQGDTLHDATTLQLVRSDREC